VSGFSPSAVNAGLILGADGLICALVKGSVAGLDAGLDAGLG